jgi:hypothetical protein
MIAWVRLLDSSARALNEPKPLFLEMPVGVIP